MTKPKICSDCKWHETDQVGHERFHVCAHPPIKTVDLVTGALGISMHVKNCFVNRAGGSGFCGPEGQNFEPKDANEN